MRFMWGGSVIEMEKIFLVQFVREWIEVADMFVYMFWHDVNLQIV